MIETYCEYIRKYIIGKKVFPGEHHFVTVYLVPKIYKLTGKIPDFVNPDGTKNINGDIIYEADKVYIEVKHNKLQFTKSQYNNWIINRSNHSPNYIIGIGDSGILFQNWNIFIHHFRNWIKKERNNDLMIFANNKNSPSLSIKAYNKYFDLLLKNEYFDTTSDYEKLLEEKIKKMFK
jgi:hypothetical protein